MFTQDEMKWLYQLLDQIVVPGVENKTRLLSIMVKVLSALREQVTVTSEEEE